MLSLKNNIFNTLHKFQKKNRFYLINRSRKDSSVLLTQALSCPNTWEDYEGIIARRSLLITWESSFLLENFVQNSNLLISKGRSWDDKKSSWIKAINNLSKILTLFIVRTSFTNEKKLTRNSNFLSSKPEHSKISPRKFFGDLYSVLLTRWRTSSKRQNLRNRLFLKTPEFRKFSWNKKVIWSQIYERTLWNHDASNILLQAVKVAEIFIFFI